MKKAKTVPRLVVKIAQMMCMSDTKGVCDGRVLVRMDICNPAADLLSRYCRVVFVVVQVLLYHGG